MNLGRALATIGGWTILSRVTAVVRETLMARYLGNGILSDAFVVAFRLPNLFRSLFAEGAFNAAFVPLFASKLESEGPAEARLFAEHCMAALTWIVLLVVAVIEMTMPWAIRLIALGYDDMAGKLELTTELARITFPYLLFITLVCLQSGVLNAMGRFGAAAGTPVLLNVTAVAVLVLLTPYVPTPAHAMAWGVFASGLSQFAWLLYSMRKAEMSLRWVRPHLSPDVRLLLKRVIPGALGAGIYQVNLTVNTMIASKLSNGAVSAVYYAERVNQLPLGVVGVAMGTALLPLLSRQLRAGDGAAARESQNRGMELTMLLTVPATFALIALAHPIIAVIYEWGKFTAANTAMVAPTLQAFALGLPAFVIVKVLTPGFFARGDIRTPVKLAVICMATNVVFNLLLMHPLQQVGMALSTTIAAWVNVAGLAWLLHRRGFYGVDRRLLDRTARIVFSAMIMTAVLFVGQNVLAESLATANVTRIIALFALIFIAIGFYGVAVLTTGATHVPELKAMFARKK